MKINRLTIAILPIIVFFSAFSFAQQPNPLIKQLVEDVSAKKIEEYNRKLVSFGTRNTLSSQTDPKRGIGAAANWIFDEFSKISADCGGCLEVERQSFIQEKGRRIPEPIKITNLVATLRGTTDPDRIYVVSGHYDSMCSSSTDGDCDAPGANDDGSGTAAVIEMARVMSKKKFEATIVFMTVAGEEQGLLGARHFAAEAVKNKLNIDAMFTNDIIGGVKTMKDMPDRNSVRVFAEGVPSNETEQQANLRRSIGGENDSATRQLGRFIYETALAYSPGFGVQLIYRRDRYLRGGDHIPFLENGFPAVRFTEPHEDYEHQHQNVRTEDGIFYGDTPDYLDYGYIANVTKINVAALASLAIAPARPKNVGFDLSRLTNDTDITWDQNTESDLAGYEVVWRRTTEPFWTDSKFVENVTKYTMVKMSKDNYFFGVRAVDKDGNKSPVVFPGPVFGNRG
ncbi:MAG: M20/M25/M40 family metallo-hydrolase [Acidobacteriota bacterium]|nr:M20/M25/M40 family metallo-hydrolase [Acidobacteriota bacterium]MDH3529512.1 M20/M25/M40 family metallo-hydrolase [Acidobacteriota bacterium]